MYIVTLLKFASYTNSPAHERKTIEMHRNSRFLRLFTLI